MLAAQGLPRRFGARVDGPKEPERARENPPGSETFHFAGDPGSLSCLVGLPHSIEREVRAFLRRVLAHGFLRVRCDDCVFERLVPLWLLVRVGNVLPFRRAIVVRSGLGSVAGTGSRCRQPSLAHHHTPDGLRQSTGIAGEGRVPRDREGSRSTWRGRSRRCGSTCGRLAEDRGRRPDKSGRVSQGGPGHSSPCCSRDSARRLAGSGASRPPRPVPGERSSRQTDAALADARKVAASALAHFRQVLRAFSQAAPASRRASRSSMSRSRSASTASACRSGRRSVCACSSSTSAM